MTVTVKHPFVSTVPDGADTSLVRPSNWNADHTIVGLGTAAELNAGVANGVATLDGGGTVPLSQIPASIQGSLNYQGTWNASTNTPTLASGVGTKGYYYAVSVAGSTNLDGITSWNVGDMAVYSGTAWQKIDNTDAVTSVNGYTGTVVLAVGDISGAANAPTNTNITSMTGVTGGISSPDYIQFDTAYATALTAGQLGWDGNNTLGLGMAGGNVTQHIGEDQFFYYKASSAVTKGQVVMFTGAVGASGVPTGAPATGIADGTYIMGIAAETVATNGFGLVQTFGTLRNVDTSTYADGEILWYNPAVTGGLTATKPSAPNVKVQMAAVINGGSSGGGTILIRIDSGSQLGGTDSNVQIGTPTSGNTLIYDAVAGYWKNANISAGTGVSVTNGAGAITVANTGVTSFSAGTTGLTPSTGTTGAVTLAGTLGVANGGTGLTSVTANRIPYGNGTGALNTSANLTFDGTTLTSATGANFVTTSGSVGVGTSSPANKLEVFGNNVRNTARASTTSGDVYIEAQASDYWSGPTYTGTSLRQFGSAATGTTAGLSNASLGLVTFQNNSAGLIYTNGGAPIVFGTASVDRGRVSSTGVWSLGAAPGAESLRVTPVASAVNYYNITGGVTTGSPYIAAQGSDANIHSQYLSKGTYGHIFNTGSAGNFQFYVAHTASAVNYLQVTGSATGARTSITSAGSDTNVGINYIAKGAEGHAFFSNGGSAIQMFVSPTASAVNYLQVTGATTTNDPTISAAGTDTNIDIQLVPKGTGGVRFTGPLLPNNLAGTSGQVLTSAGAGAVPTWTTPVSSNITATGLWENAATISSNYTIASGNNAMSAGPITIASGVTVTVPSGSVWTVV